MTDLKLNLAWGVLAACVRQVDPKVIAFMPEKEQETRELAFRFEDGIYKVTVERAPEFPHHIEAKP